MPIWAICIADNSGDEFVDAGSGSEAEELEDFNDEDEDDEGTQESAPNTSGAPQARLINNRGLKKTGIAALHTTKAAGSYV